MSDSAESFDLTCSSDFPVVGFFPGERLGSIIRLICLLVTASITSSWIGRRNVRRLLLFFSHWLSGLVYLVAQRAMSEMVCLCYATLGFDHLMKAFNFFEVAGSNMLAATNLTMCINLALIIKSHRELSFVPNFSTPRLMLTLLALSVAAAVAAVPVWTTLVMTGTQFYPEPSSADDLDWSVISTLLFELVGGIVMATIVALLAIFRTKELLQVWALNRRIKLYFLLTAIAIVVDLTIGVGGVISHALQRGTAEYISITHSMRAIHIALDTLVLYGGVGETKFVISGNGSSGSLSGGGARGGGSTSEPTTRRKPTNGRATTPA